MQEELADDRASDAGFAQQWNDGDADMGESGTYTSFRPLIHLDLIKIEPEDELAMIERGASPWLHRLYHPILTLSQGAFRSEIPILSRRLCCMKTSNIILMLKTFFKAQKLWFKTKTPKRLQSRSLLPSKPAPSQF